MSIIKYIIATVVIIFIAATIWYHQPIEHIQTYHATTFEADETTTIELKVKKYRKFFRPTVIEGELIQNNKVFKSSGVTISNSWLEQLYMKQEGQVNPVQFIHIDPNINLADWESWYIMIWSLEDLQSLMLSYKPEGRDVDSILYFAPATNKEEVEQINKKLFNY